MAVLINWKICDNSKDCNGPTVCPTGAFYWDDKEKTIAIDDSKCIKCGKCEQSCPVGAIRVARTEAEYKKIKDELDKDPRKISDLFVDRYGGKPITEDYLVSEDRFESSLESGKLVVAELFKNSSIKCLIDSIPLKDLFQDEDVKYIKLELVSETLPKKYNLTKLPVLLFFNKTKLIGKIEGYFDLRQKEKLKEKINKLFLKPNESAEIHKVCLPV